MFKKIRLLSTTKKAAGGLLLLAIVAIIGGSQSGQPTAQFNAKSAGSGQVQGNSTTAPTPQVTTKTITKTQSIPYQSVIQNDASLPKGQSEVITQGVNGTETLTYKITYTNGQQTDKQLLGKVVTAQPVDQVTAIGTYVAPAPAASCPDGTYVNSAGNTVCSPYSAPSTPAGATAQCVDGTYSFTQSRSGTCSHHGGVASWL